MKEIIDLVSELNGDERHLLSLAYKNIIGSLRVSWRNLSAIEQENMSRGSQKHDPILREYRRTIENELEKVCRDVLEDINEKLIPNASTGDSRVFYYKMYAYLTWLPIACLNGRSD